MKKYLLPQNCNKYKANLHCHSTFSDGKYDVYTLKEMYKSRGYSVVAFSDHNVLVPHPELESDDFVPLTATEINVDKGSLTYHLNFFSSDKTKTEFPPIQRIYSVEGVNEIIKTGNENGFLCQYNHPRWSFQQAPDYVGLKGLWGFEVFNSGCQVEMDDGWGDYEYETICRDGRVYPVATATDDNHNGLTDDLQSPYCDSFKGWTTVFAPSLSYDNIYNAMKNGDCYATTGPEISELYAENGRVYIKCTPSAYIGIRFETRRQDRVCSFEDEITQADFDISGEFDHFRIVVRDKYNNKAMTRSYTKKDL